MTNTYSGVPDDFADRVATQQTVAFADQVRSAIQRLTDGQQGKYAATIQVLASLIGEAEDQ